MNAREPLFKMAPAGSVMVIHDPMLDGGKHEFLFDPPELAS